MNILILIFTTCISVGGGDWSSMDANFYICDNGIKLTTLTRQNQEYPLFYIINNGKEETTWLNREESGVLENTIFYATIAIESLQNNKEK